MQKHGECLRKGERDMFEKRNTGGILEMDQKGGKEAGQRDSKTLNRAMPMSWLQETKQIDPLDRLVWGWGW